MPAAQKAGPIPLGDECGAAMLSTGTFDKFGFFTLTGQGYVAPAHEDAEFPRMRPSPMRVARDDHGP